MKRVASGAEPAVLASFRADNPSGTWSEFKEQAGNETVFESLARAQGFICAYCEIRISRPLRGQVEHFVPKSRSTSGRNLHLEFGNLLACCEGGTWRYDPERAARQIPETQHCGALKGDQSPAGRMLDPRAIPGGALIWQVASSGEMTVDSQACGATGLDSAVAESTLSFLGLNRRVLLRLRNAVMQQLDQDAFASSDDMEHDVARFLDFAVQQLLPNDRGELNPFWSTIRAWAGPGIEPLLNARANEIPGLSD